MVNVIKANGDSAPFIKHKIERTVLKAGGSKKFAQQIANQVSAKVYEGMQTRDILKLTLKLLKKQPGLALRYDLKRAIMSLGPHGFSFEQFLAQVLANEGYKTKTNLVLKGKATFHEVDVIAEKKKVFMIEAKYHNHLGNHTNSQVAMYTYARYLDLKNNPKNKIDQGWLITNTKCTHHAVEYARGVGLKITTWDYASKGNRTLQDLIKLKKSYPITILNSVNGKTKQKLLNANIILAKSLLTEDFHQLQQKTGIKEKILKRIIIDAQELFN